MSNAYMGIPYTAPYKLTTDKIVNDFVRYMLARTQSMFEWRGLPDTIPARDLELLLQVNGFAGITDVGGSLYAFYGGLGGEPNPYYLPTILTVANPALAFNKMLKIDDDVIVIRGDAMYSGLMPLLRRYGTLLAETEKTLKVATVNMRAPRVLAAGDNNTRESAEKFLKRIDDGETGVIAETAFLDNAIKAIEFGTDSGYRITDIIEARQYIIASLYNEIGLQSNYNMKRERLGDEEIASNEAILLPLVDNMLKCRQEGAEKVNDLFGTDISVELSSSWKLVDEEMEVEAKGGESDDVGDGSETDTEDIQE